MGKEPKTPSLIKFSTLLLLHEKGQYGYELIKELGKRYGKKISAGEVYPFLKYLRKHKFVIIKKSGAREKKTYLLTKSGKSYVREMLTKFNYMIDSAVRSKLEKCEHCGCEIYHGAYFEIIKGKKTAFCCSACAKTFK
ncbi:MAG: helix-turn-helix transcriptional regulator [Candidatus Aenigmarchaeota archaeon]|nr:helix-turn-helix transcriptional regulator [Candidatus Aenigmarchaeota archaeon]